MSDPSTNSAEAQPQSVYEALAMQLGCPGWKPETPFRWFIVKLRNPGRSTEYIVVVDHPLGRIPLMFSHQAFGEFIRAAQSEHSGIVLPPSGG